MIKGIAVFVACALSTFSGAYAADDFMDRQRAKLAEQVILYDHCIDSYAFHNANADATPTEISIAAAGECQRFHDNLLRIAESASDEIMGETDTEEKRLLAERARRSTAATYRNLADEQAHRAQQRAIGIVIKERSATQ